MGAAQRAGTAAASSAPALAGAERESLQDAPSGTLAVAIELTQAWRAGPGIIAWAVGR